MQLITPKQTLIERLYHCNHCEYKRGQGFTATCRQCGCVIEAKTRLANQSCPVGTWQDVQAPQHTALKTTQQTQTNPKQRGNCCGR